MNIEKYYKDNQTKLDLLIIKEYNKLHAGKTIFLAGSALYMESFQTSNKKLLDIAQLGNFRDTVFITFPTSKAKLSKLFKDADFTIKSSMSSKVNVLVWNENSWYHKGEFENDNYNYEHFTWDEFLRPMIKVIINDMTETDKGEN